MSKAAVPHAPAPATLAEQKSDFTAEGAPPPGKVSTSTPVTARDAPQTVPAAKKPARATIKVKRPTTAR